MDKKQWFRARKWGVFLHYLNAVQNNPEKLSSNCKCTDWDECVRELDTDLIAQQLHDVNAGYLVFTIMQGTQHMIAPNDTFARLTGIAPGKGCSTRDLIRDLIDSLGKYDIPLFLYYTGDGPYKSEEAAEKILAPRSGGREVLPEFVKNWTDVLREYSLRYGNDVKGWWVDGLFSEFYPGADNPYIGMYKEAALAGNPDALFSANYYGCAKSYPEKEISGIGRVIFGDFYHEIAPPTEFCDYTGGEVVSFDVYPQEPDIGGAVPHVLSFLGIPEHPVEVYNGWGAHGSKYSPEFMRRYVECVNRLGGVVSIDCALHRDGSITSEQLAVLSALADVRN